MRRSTQARPHPPRLGPDRLPALSLDTDTGRIPEQAEPTEAAVRVAFDYEAFIREYPLTAIERVVCRAYFQRDIEAYELPSRLGLTPKQAKTALANILAKLADAGGVSRVRSGHSTRRRRKVKPQGEALKRSPPLAYCETLPSGRRVWNLATLTPGFLETLLIERQNLYSPYSQRDADNLQKTGAICPGTYRSLMATIIELNEKKAAESAKLERISERSHSANLALEDAARALELAETRFKDEQEDALLNERTFSPAAGEKAIREAGAKVTTARAALISARAVVAKQSALCEGIEAQIQGRRHEAFMNELAPARTKLLDGIANLVRDAWAVNDIGARHQVDMYTLGRGMFPPADPSDELSDFIFREMLGSLVNDAIRLRLYLAHRYGTLPPWAKRYVA